MGTPIAPSTIFIPCTLPILIQFLNWIKLDEIVNHVSTGLPKIILIGMLHYFQQGLYMRNDAVFGSLACCMYICFVCVLHPKSTGTSKGCTLCNFVGCVYNKITSFTTRWKLVNGSCCGWTPSYKTTICFPIFRMHWQNPRQTDTVFIVEQEYFINHFPHWNMWNATLISRILAKWIVHRYIIHTAEALCFDFNWQQL